MLKATTKSCLAEGYQKPSTECNKVCLTNIARRLRWLTKTLDHVFSISPQYDTKIIQQMSSAKWKYCWRWLSSLAAWTSFQYDAIILTFHLKCKRCCWLIVDFLFYWPRERHLHRVESLVSVFYDVWGWKPLTEPLLRKSFPGSLWGWMLSIGKHRSDSGM